MKNFFDKVQRVIKVTLYFCTVIPPVIDAVKGIIDGIKAGLSDAEEERFQELLKKEEQKIKAVRDGKI